MGPSEASCSEVEARLGGREAAGKERWTPSHISSALNGLVLTVKLHPLAISDASKSSSSSNSCFCCCCISMIRVINIRLSHSKGYK